MFRELHRSAPRKAQRTDRSTMSPRTADILSSSQHEKIEDYKTNSAKSSGFRKLTFKESVVLQAFRSGRGNEFSDFQLTASFAGAAASRQCKRLHALCKPARAAQVVAGAGQPMVVGPRRGSSRSRDIRRASTSRATTPGGESHQPGHWPSDV
jgi:hypothetical protein